MVLRVLVDHNGVFLSEFCGRPAQDKFIAGEEFLIACFLSDTKTDDCVTPDNFGIR